MKFELKDFQINSARSILDEIDEARAAFRFHHVSTDEVFGDLPFDQDIFTEETPYAPSSPYSASKAASDHFVRAWHETYGLPVVLSNCSNNYGPFHFPEKLIPLVILNALEGRPLPVYGRGENVRDWLYVDDHAEAVWRILQHGKKGQTYDIGGKTELSNLEIVHQIIELIDHKLSSLIRFVHDRPGHDFRYSIDTKKIETELNWSPKTQLRDGLIRTIRWYSSQIFFPSCGYSKISQ